MSGAPGPDRLAPVRRAQLSIDDGELTELGLDGESGLGGDGGLGGESGLGGDGGLGGESTEPGEACCGAVRVSFEVAGAACTCVSRCGAFAVGASGLSTDVVDGGEMGDGETGEGDTGEGEGSLTETTESVLSVESTLTGEVTDPSNAVSSIGSGSVVGPATAAAMPKAPAATAAVAVVAVTVRHVARCFTVDSWVVGDTVADPPETGGRRS